MQDRAILWIDVYYECGVDISIDTIVDPLGQPYPPNHEIEGGCIFCKRNFGQTVADRPKLCIDSCCEIIGEGALICATFHSPIIPKFRYTWCTQSRYKCMQIVTGFALCLDAGTFVQRIVIHTLYFSFACPNFRPMINLEF